LSKIEILVVDDHPIVRMGLRALLEAQPDMKVVGEAVDGHTALAMALETQPSVVVMDITMGAMNGLTVTKEITSRLPQTKVLVLTIHDEEEYLRRALEAGATGYVLKQAAYTELSVAIRAVDRGEVFVYPSLTRVLLGETDPAAGAGGQQPDVEPLSDREQQILRLVALGHTSQEIADQLLLSVKTIETYRARVMEKLHLKSRSALVRYALKRGLLDNLQ